MPLTATGKIDKKALRARYGEFSGWGDRAPVKVARLAEVLGAAIGDWPTSRQPGCRRATGWKGAERAPGQVLATLGVTVEIEGESKSALVADWLALQCVAGDMAA